MNKLVTYQIFAGICLLLSWVVMLNSTPKKAVILPSEEIRQFHCVICCVEVSTKDRLSLFGRSKLDLKGAISQLLEGDLQITADQEHYICTKKCLSRVKKYLKLSSDLTQLSHELKQEILACNSVRIKRLNPPISPIQPITTTKEQSAAQRQSKAAKKSLFPSQTVEGTTVLLVTPISTPLLPPLSSQLPTVALSSETSIAAPIPHDPRHHAVISPPTQDNTATASRKSKETANNQDQEPSVEEPSILRSKKPDEMKNFTLSKVNDEFKTRAPLFYSFLLSCATSGNKDEPMPSVVVAGSVLLRQRNVFMNATQSLISLMVKQNGVQKLLIRLNSMKLSLSAKSTLKRLDTYGLKFEEEVNKIKGKTSVNQPSTTTDIHASASRSEEVPDCHNSYKIVLDNIDLKILARDMTSERQNKDIHWCNHMAVKNRVVDQQNNKIQTDLLELDNSKILPEARDSQLLKGDYIQLVARILVEHLPCFKFLEKVCPKHIPHHYSKEMAEKSEMIPLGVLFKSENNNEEMVEILSEIQGYSNMRDQTTIPVVGDQLTVERGVNVIEALQNSYTPQERLEGVHMEVADGHSVVTFLKVCITVAVYYIKQKHELKLV
ncbi:hypothetical protein AC249_AIPGENE17536 [Exaiptasia diaphana]|nr:hypothetical protein AC249_AIPGENE17536 [Exaiptasia diaphana]